MHVKRVFVKILHLYLLAIVLNKPMIVGLCATKSNKSDFVIVAMKKAPEFRGLGIITCNLTCVL